MGKVAKVEQKAKATQAAVEILDGQNHNPLLNLVEMTRTRLPVPEDEGLLKSMLLTDYEMYEDPDSGDCYLRLRRRLVMEIEMELARYKHPRLKASDDGTSKGGGGVTVQIVNYGGEQSKPEGRATTVEVKKL
jgi:hypothetical protein